MPSEVYTVTNGTNTMTLHDKNQLAAFLANGWEETKPARKQEKAVNTEAKAEVKTRGRKKAAE